MWLLDLEIEKKKKNYLDLKEFQFYRYKITIDRASAAHTLASSTKQYPFIFDCFTNNTYYYKQN